jgi:RNA-directed DNA polymerase
MSTELKRIGEKARACAGLVFTTLYHHVTDIDNLRESYKALDGRKATGVDGTTKAEYGANLEENLQELSGKLKRMGYRPNPKRRSYVPKPGSDKKRPLGISCLEDKIVEEMVKRVLEPIYETEFEECSYGYRPGRSPQDCVQALGATVQQGRVSYVVEADIRGFFDHVNHEWLMKFLRKRIGDDRILRLINRMLKSGILEDGLVKASEEGTPQGSIISPLLSNVYLHYVLDQWFSQRVIRGCKGEAYFFRFADDFVACFQYKNEAEIFRRRLGERLGQFHLQLAEEKTSCIAFGRFARDNAAGRGEKPGEFTFLGFTFYCGKTRNGLFKVKRRTSRKKLGQSLSKFTEWARESRKVLRKGEMFRRAKTRIVGHLNYYAITDNGKMCSTYLYLATRILFKWINRKSQRKSYTWKGFNQVLKWVGWPTVRIRVQMSPFERGALPQNVQSKSRIRESLSYGSERGGDEHLCKACA